VTTVGSSTALTQESGALRVAGLFRRKRRVDTVLYWSVLVITRLGIAVIVALSKQATALAGTLRLVIPENHLLVKLRRMGLVKLWPIYQDVESALGAVARISNSATAHPATASPAAAHPAAATTAALDTARF
jgi:hypothetical protein